jgi:3-methyl-2-oxobutanoate hydroxymethyltransferase
MLGMNKNFAPRFLRRYLNGFELVKGAVTQYDADVKNGTFPTEEESYT